LESEKINLESVSKSRFSKEILEHKKQVVRLLDEVARLKALSKPVASKALIKLEKAMPPAILEVKPVSSRKELIKSTELPVIVASTVPEIAPSETIQKVVESPKGIDWKAASTLFGKKVKPDDHQIIEGVGPKLNALLKKNKITTWSQLSNTPIRDIKAILAKAGTKFSLADPTSWPAQARLASMGEWTQLKKLQNNLIAGKSKKKNKKQIVSKSIPGIKTTLTSKPVEKKVITPEDIKKGNEILDLRFKLDDLKIIEGIGPKIEQLLRKANIKTWISLSNTNTKEIQAILDKAGSRFALADPSTWNKQAKFAAAGNWSSLKEFQKKIKSGKA
jgi:predicted flap endonuclease-1-like 5' DNA nuclease